MIYTQGRGDDKVQADKDTTFPFCRSNLSRETLIEKGQVKRGYDDNREGGCSDSVCQEMEFQAKSRLSRHKYNLRNFMLLVLSLDVSHLLRPDLAVVKIDFWMKNIQKYFLDSQEFHS